MADGSITLMHFERTQKAETYKAQMYCGNCHHQFAVQVPKGTLCIHATWTCPNCGCTKEQIEEAMRAQQGPAGYAKAVLS